MIIPPHSLNIMMHVFIVGPAGGNNLEIRSIPYPPNFRRIAARIIEPATGASTCAFGSHKWVKNIGSLIIKAVFRRSHCRDIE